MALLLFETPDKVHVHNEDWYNNYRHCKGLLF